MEVIVLVVLWLCLASSDQYCNQSSIVSVRIFFQSFQMPPFFHAAPISKRFGNNIDNEYPKLESVCDITTADTASNCAL